MVYEIFESYKGMGFDKTEKMMSMLYPYSMMFFGRRNFKSWTIKLLQLKLMIIQHHPDWDTKRVEKYMNWLLTDNHYGMRARALYIDSWDSECSKVIHHEDVNKISFDNVIHHFGFKKPTFDNLEWYCSFMEYHNDPRKSPYFKDPIFRYAHGDISMYGTSLDYFERLKSHKQVACITPYRPFNNTNINFSIQVPKNLSEYFKKGNHYE